MMNADDVRALQERLATHRPIDPDDPETHNAKPIGTKVDGILGRQTIAHLQVFLGRDMTGVLDGDDVRALQAHLGFTAPSGVLDGPTVDALRAALLAGKF